MLRALLAFTLLTGCNLSSGNSSSSATGEQTDCVKPDRGVNNGPLPEGCGKIENGDIGSATSIEASTTITITGWIAKDGEQGEFIGFTYTPTVAPGTITIKAGGEVYQEDGDGTWIHPAGTFGPEASAISNIVVCEGDGGSTPPGDGDGDGNDGDGDGCTDPTPPPDPEECTSNEDCESGICQDGVCVDI